MKNRCRGPPARRLAERGRNSNEFRLSINPLAGSLPPSFGASCLPVARMTPSKRECHSLAFAAAAAGFFFFSSFKEWPSCSPSGIPHTNMDEALASQICCTCKAKSSFRCRGATPGHNDDDKQKIDFRKNSSHWNPVEDVYAINSRSRVKKIRR